MNRTTAICTAVGAALLAIGGIAFALRGPDKSETGLPEDLSVEALTAQAETKPIDLMRKMRDTMERDDLTDEQRRELGTNMRQTMQTLIASRIAELNATTTPQQRNEVLDRHIDSFQEVMKEMRAMREQRRKKAEADGETEDDMRNQMRERWGNRSTEERKARSESRSADDMMQMMSYMMAVRQRMQERGMDMPQFGPGGGGRPGRGPGGG
jgi:hypothetical protein